MVANVFGVYHQILNNISQEDAFKNTIKFLNGRIQLEKEKQQQVLLTWKRFSGLIILKIVEWKLLEPLIYVHWKKMNE